MPKNYCERCGNSEANNIMNIQTFGVIFHIRLCDDCLEVFKQNKLKQNENK